MLSGWLRAFWFLKIETSVSLQLRLQSWIACFRMENYLKNGVKKILFLLNTLSGIVLNVLEKRLGIRENTAQINVPFWNIDTELLAFQWTYMVYGLEFESQLTSAAARLSFTLHMIQLFNWHQKLVCQNELMNIITESMWDSLGCTYLLQ